MPWLILIVIALVIGIRPDKGICGAVNAANYKAFDRKQKELARKHGGIGYKSSFISKATHGAAAYEAYEKEEAELRRQYGIY